MIVGKALFFGIVTSLVSLSVSAGGETPQQAISSAEQLVVVITDGWQSTTGELRRYQRDGQSGWVEVAEITEVVVGKNGLAWGRGLHGDLPADAIRKREGDGKAPAGLFALGEVFGYAAATEGTVASLKMPYRAAGSETVCVDDPASEFYNRITERQAGGGVPWKSAEKMRRRDHLYRWGVVVEHNGAEVEAGAGSCIFLHVWRAAKRPTVGCTALAEEDIEALIGWLDSDSHPLLVQLPKEVYEQRREAWGLP